MTDLSRIIRTFDLTGVNYNYYDIGKYYRENSMYNYNYQAIALYFFGEQGQEYETTTFYFSNDGKLTGVE